MTTGQWTMGSDHPMRGTAAYVYLGLLALAVPTLISVAQRYWQSAEGSQGPLILATAGWLLWRQRNTLRENARPLAGVYWPLTLIAPVAVYTFARTYGSAFGETLALYLVGLMTAAIYLGPGAIRRHLFVFAYPAFIIVPPVPLVTELTQPLRIAISSWSVALLHVLGYPVALAGASVQVAQYELLVKTACAGLGSMFTLCAVAAFYVYLRRGSPTHTAILTLAIVPVAILTNFVRVILLILMTWYCGVTTAQGIAHELAGLLMFATALTIMFVIDELTVGDRHSRRDKDD